MFRRLIALLLLAACATYFAFVREDEASDGLTWVELGRDNGNNLPPLEPPPYEPEPSLEPGAGAALVQEALEGLPVVEAAQRKALRGKVVDLAGAPVAGIAVERRHAYLDAGHARSGADGRFEIVLNELHGELVTRSDDWLLVGGERFLSDFHEADFLLVVAPAVTLSGRVVDPAGQPIPDAAVTLVQPGDALVRFGIVAPPLEHDSQRGWSDRDGLFKLGPVPRIAGARVEATLTGAEPGSAEVPADATAPLTIVLSDR
ncbi:MAG: carboxypeptidase regulatory-like domain-containing protein [Planctomycetota bacterium]|nr:carboxypeptidase regulatory-like domain-containing protein [Planctomycetota bacterium]